MSYTVNLFHFHRKSLPLHRKSLPIDHKSLPRESLEPAPIKGSALPTNRIYKQEFTKRFINRHLWTGSSRPKTSQKSSLSLPNLSLGRRPRRGDGRRGRGPAEGRRGPSDRGAGLPRHEGHLQTRRRGRVATRAAAGDSISFGIVFNEMD